MGDEFLWAAPVTDMSSAIGLTATLTTLTVPTGLQVLAKIMANVIGPSSLSVGAASIYSPDLTTLGGSSYNIGSYVNATGATGMRGFGEVTVRTNTVAQVNIVAWTASSTLTMVTIGWVDRRGRDN